MLVERMSQQEFWRRRYLSRPYLKDVTDSQLADRQRYIIENITTLTAGGQVGFLPPEPHGKYWLELQTHIQEAYKGRGGPPNNFLKDAMIARPSYPVPPPVVKALQGVSLPEAGTYLVKFGERKHMRALHEQGQLRISPASKYSDASLNAAVRDDELKRSIFMLRSEVRMEAFDHKTGRSIGPIEPLENVTYFTEAKTDYYVYCMGLSLDLRLFQNFQSDACVIFHNRSNFQSRLHDEIKKRLPDWNGFDQPVHYFDPYNCTKQELNVFSSKHHRYWYQHEYRFGWLPSSNLDGLPHLFLELGDMREISILVEV